MATENHGLSNLQGASDAWSQNFTTIDQKMLLRGADADKPAPGTAGRLYITDNTAEIYRDTGTAWDVILTGADANTSYSDDGVEVVPKATDVNFGPNLGVSDDGDGTITISQSGSNYTDEDAQDAVGTILSAAFTYDDTGNAITLGPHVGTADAHHTRFSDEEAQDAVGTILGTQFTYDDVTPGITLNQGSGSGLDADLLDGVELANISWADVAMSQSDVSVSNLGVADATLDMGGNQLDRVGGIEVTGDTTSGEAKSNIYIEDGVPQIEFNDTDITGNGGRYWLHHNGGNLYILKDDNNDGSWDSPHPLKIHPNGDFDLGYGLQFNGGAPQTRPVVAQSTAPSDTNAIWIDTS